MNTSKSRSDAFRDRAIALLELVFHVGRLVEEGRLSRDDAAALTEILHAQAGFPQRTSGD